MERRRSWAATRRVQCSIVYMTGTFTNGGGSRTQYAGVAARLDVVTYNAGIYPASMQFHWRYRHSKYDLGSSSLRGHIQGRGFFSFNAASLAVQAFKLWLGFFFASWSRAGPGSFIQGVIFYFSIEAGSGKGLPAKKQTRGSADCCVRLAAWALPDLVCDLLALLSRGGGGESWLVAVR